MGDSSDTPAATSLPVRPNETSSSHLTPGDAADPNVLTPSLLTPNTRADAEFAFSTNAMQQTDSAAQATAPPNDPGSPTLSRPAATRRPLAPPRSSSSNYIAALAASPTVPPGFDASKAQVFSPVTVELAQREGQAGGGAGVGASGSEATPVSPDTQGWNERDLKRERQKGLMDAVTGQGYDSAQDVVKK